MNGSRLGRGRMGRVAILAGGVVVVILLVFLYRSTSSEISRLKDVNAKCTQFQEDLSRKLRGIFEYKEQLEKLLANEKSANAVAKEELMQKASRERTLRDKDSLEAMQRYNSLQQNYKMLQTEHQDLKENCKKREEVAQENVKSFETRLDDMRMQLQHAADDKEKSMEHLKSKYTEVISAKEQLEEQYENLKKATGNNNGEVERLQKQVIQLQRELTDVKKSPHFSVGGLKDSSQLQPRIAPNEVVSIAGVSKDPKADKLSADNNQMQVIRPSSPQQAGVSGASLQSPSEGSSRLSVEKAPAARVKLPEGVPPIPRLIEPELESQGQQESAGQAPAPVQQSAVAADAESKLPKAEDAEQEADHQQLPPAVVHQPKARHVGEQVLDRHEADSWYKLKLGVQEVGDPHHLDKNGFDNGVGNEDIEQYDDYNYKEPQNKNSDLHLEEGEDEREDEDDYMHNNMNAVKHE